MCPCADNVRGLKPRTEAKEWRFALFSPFGLRPQTRECSCVLPRAASVCSLLYRSGKFCPCCVKRSFLPFRKKGCLLSREVLFTEDVSIRGKARCANGRVVGNRRAGERAAKSLLVGERCACSEAEEGTPRGVRASENVGISSEKTGENPVRRKPKVS